MRGAGLGTAFGQERPVAADESGCSTFDMCGVMPQAEPAVACPLDGGVRRRGHGTCFVHFMNPR